ncbi:MAG: PLP-dependent aminotransferase family protein [Mesorhizobium sp.]
MTDSETITPRNLISLFAARSAPPTGLGHGDESIDFDFSDGYAFPKCLPDITREASAAAALRNETMQYADVFGIDELRDLICSYVASDGVQCRRENVMIVNGAKHGLDLACRVFIEPGDTVIVTAPTYMTAISILRTHEVDFLPIEQDNQGLRVDILEQKLQSALDAGEKLPKLLFDVPDFHNPTGITMSLERRRLLIALAERFGFFIVEDDPYRRIRFEGEPVPPLKSLDKNGVVIALGTASKILAPGLRIGWVIAADEIIERMAAQKSDGGTSPFNQRIMIELLRGNQISHHIDQVTVELRKHRDVMLDSLARYLPEIHVRKPEGGYYLWARIPQSVDADVLAALALQNGVKVYSGRKCYPLEPQENALRICFSYEDESRIPDGIARLGNIYDRLKKDGASENTIRAAAERLSKMGSY